MTLKKPDIRILTVWRIRLLLAAIAPSFLSAVFVAFSASWLWWTLTGIWVAAFLYFYIFYYPIKYRKLSYSRSKRCLLIHCGVIYTRVKAVPFASIQYVAVASTPIQRLFGLSSLYVFTAGSTAYIPGLPHGDAVILQGVLTPSAEGGESLA